MYEQFFGLKEKPFSLTPDTDYFYRYREHQEALNVLLVALQNGEGFVRVVGEVGTGKTLLCRQLLKLLQDECTLVYLPSPLLTPLELYQAIAKGLDIEVSHGATVQQIGQCIWEQVVCLQQRGRPVVLIVDEAQAMPLKSLEALRLLSNLETEKEKLLHVFFFAQPEFEQRLKQRDLRQLLQRISFSYRLACLQLDELPGYLDHRLKVAGCQKTGLFRPAAVRLLHDASQGVPRLVNLLAHKALLAAYGKGRTQIDKQLMLAAIKDTKGGEGFSPGAGWRNWLAELAAVVGVAVVTLLVLRALQ